MPCTLIFGSARTNRCQSTERDRIDNGLMHGLGETVPPDFYVWCPVILIEVDRVSKDSWGGSPATLESTDRSGCIAHTKRDAEHDFNQQKFHALSLLDSMFGGLREALDSDVDMPEIPPLQTSPSSEPSPLKEGFKEPDLIPTGCTRGLMLARPHRC